MLPKACRYDTLDMVGYVTGSTINILVVNVVVAAVQLICISLHL